MTKQIKNISIIRAEGLIEETGIEHTATSWKGAADILLKMSATAPSGGGYDKTDFHIEFEDGQEYSGTYDLKHHSDETPSLYEHVKNHVTFYAGDYKPEWMKEASYQEIISRGNPNEYKVFGKEYLGL